MIQEEPVELTNSLVFGPLTECGQVYTLSPQEELIVDILYWARNAAMGLEFSKKNRFYPGPHGHLDPKRRWMPHPQEGCDLERIEWLVNTGTISPKTGQPMTRFNVWAMRDHCKTRQHITYLLKHRKRYLLYDGFGAVIRRLMKVATEGVLLYVNDPDPVIQQFVKDVLACRNWDINKQYNL